ncbi:MAG: amidohydrolase family protein [Candidatus Acidiferrales bacterium]|jgi:predicted TIM-barrel fold metal-dependent hydrolase
MRERRIERRRFLKGAGLATLAVAGGAASIVAPHVSGAEEAFPNSAGNEVPQLKAPPLACDCHQHIYDPARFPYLQPGAESHATVADYRRIQKRLGTVRNIIATPKPYLTDNRITLDAVSQFGANARGLAAVDPSITDAELESLKKAGISGVRFLLLGGNATETIIQIQRLAGRVNDLGWHVDFGIDAEQIVATEDLLMKFPAVLVFDHMARIPEPMGVKHPAFTIVRKLLDKGRAWVKLSLASSDSKVGPPTYADVVKVAQAYVEAAPERMVWGSNWPHPNDLTKPDDAIVFDLLSQYAHDEATRHRILVENPEVLYGFARS